MQLPKVLNKSVNIARAENRALEVHEMEKLPRHELSDRCVEEFSAKWEEEVSKSAEGKASLGTVILSVYKKELFLGAFLRLVADLSNVGASLVLRQLILWLERDHKEPDSSAAGYLYAIALGLLNFTAIMGLGVSNESSLGLFQRVRSALTCMIFNKALLLTADNGQQGSIVAMHSVDTAKFRELMFIHGLVVAPVAVVANMVAMYIFIGPSGLVSIAVLLILIACQMKLSTMQGPSIHMAHKYADQRLKAISEAIVGIRVCKFMNWEEKLVNKIESIRQDEVKFLKKLYTLRVSVQGIAHSMHMILLVVVFGIGFAAGEKIDAASVFPAMLLLNSLRHVTNSISMGFGKVTDLLVTFRRLEAFFLQPEREQYTTIVNDEDNGGLENSSFMTHSFVKHSTPNAPEYQSINSEAPNEPFEGEKEMTTEKKKSNEPAAAALDAGIAIEARNLTAGYFLNEEREDQHDTDRDKNAPAQPDKKFVPLLSDVNLKFPAEKLTLVIGATGSGKSTLLSALVGEARVSPESHVLLSSNIAYVPQEAFIMNNTVRGNILMSSEMDETFYDDTAAVCQLSADFEQLPGGDMTEIGERGINLSGGQKQRIAFARAVYSKRKIVLMDDPLSAVDSHVCRALFEECIMGALEKTTRVLVTHQVQFLPYADHIVMLRENQVVFSGSYDEFQSNSEVSAGILGAQSPHHEGGGSAGSARSGGGSARANTPGGKDKPAAVMSPSKAARAPAQKLISDEEQMSGSISGDVYKWYAGLAGGVNIAVCFISFCCWRVSLFFVDLMLSIWSKKESGFGKEKWTEGEYFYWFVICAVIGISSVIFRGYMFSRCIGAFAQNSHRTMSSRLLKAPMSFFDTTPQGRILNRFSKDMRIMDLIVSELGLFTISLVFLMVGYLLLVIASAVYMIVISVILVLVYFRVQSWYTFTIRAIKRIEAINRSPMMAIMSETLGGLVTIRAYKLNTLLETIHSTRVDGMMRALYNHRVAQFTIMWISAVMGTVLILCISILAVIFTINEDAAVVSPGQTLVVLGVAYSSTLCGIFVFLLILAAEVDASMSAAERMREYALEIPQERDVTYGTGPEDVPEPEAGWPNTGKIVFQDASLRYRDGLPLVLKNISLNIKGGEKVGIVGRTGSGKSTIMLALFRLVELAQGAVFIDGVDIANVKLSQLRNGITIIPQDPVLFQGTVRSNLDPFNSHSDEDLSIVIEKVGLADRVNGEGGLSAPVSDKGANFSVGQRQLLCLGRAIIKKCHVLLLDEATASVDFEADAMIQRTIRNEFGFCTVLTIAHRLATVIDADKILVLDGGSVAEFEHPKKLLDDMESKFFGMVSNLGEEQYLSLYEAANKAYNKKA